MFATDIYLEELPSCWWHINFKEAVLQRPCNITEVHIFYNSTIYYERMIRAFENIPNM